MEFNSELAETVLQYITENPTEWDQTTWHCGTSFCFAGHVVREHYKGEIPFNNEFGYNTTEALLITAKTDNSLEHISLAAQRLLGITDYEVDALFYSDNTLENLRTCVDLIKSGKEESLHEYHHEVLANTSDDNGYCNTCDQYLG